MRVLMISDLYPPAIGGMEREIQLLSEGLTNRKKTEVAVCTLRQDSLPEFEETNDVRVYRVNSFFQNLPFTYSDSKTKYHPPVTDWVVTRQLKRILKEENPDVVHAHNWMLYSVLPLRRKFDFALCVTFHDFGFTCPRRWSSSHRNGTCEKPLTSKCVVCARHIYGTAKSLFTYLGLLTNKVFTSDRIIFTNPNIVDRMSNLTQTKTYLEHPIDTEEYRPHKTRLHNNRILVWAKLDKIKGIDLAFGVARSLTEYEFDIPFVGDDREYYKRSKPTNVTLVPAIERGKIPSFISKYPIILGQFHIGVFGHAELEAMSCAKPVISYWNRKYDIFYDKPCPILSSKNVDQTINLIRTNFGNDDVGRVSRKWILQHHKVSRVIEKLLGIYEETIESRLLTKH